MQGIVVDQPYSFVAPYRGNILPHLVGRLLITRLIRNRYGVVSSEVHGAEKIRAAIDAGLRPVKFNTVLMRGVNDDEIEPLVARARDEGWELRFIEQLHDQFDRYRRMAPAVPGVRAELDAQHQELVSLALARDIEGARALLQSHIRISHDVALGAVPDA